MKRVLAINTSPNTDGLTATCAQEFLAGAAEAGAETELIHLNQLDIKHCQQCMNGWGICRTEGKCVLVDDFEAVRQKVFAADAWALANPVYFGDLSESAKAFTDRLRRTNIGDADKRLAGKDFVALAAAGGSGGGVSTCLMTLDRLCQHTGQRVADLIGITRRNRAYKLGCIRECGKSVVQQEWE
ncbi:MAG: flavodoxin family protein [Armatimonadetes bacterium]|nr:flavodoxin family protein [Armatimonadota bacterium]